MTAISGSLTATHTGTYNFQLGAIWRTGVVDVCSHLIRENASLLLTLSNSPLGKWSSKWEPLPYRWILLQPWPHSN